MSRIDPLRGFTVLEVRRREHPLTFIREAIELASQGALVETRGGHRHHRHPLTEQEREHHEKVDRFRNKIGRSGVDAT